MSNIQLDSYTFEKNPSEAVGMLKDVNYASSVLTYSNVGYFNWGASIAGVQITFKWAYMPAGMYDSLQTLWVGTGPYTLTPNDDSSKTFQVQILDLKGAYFLTMSTTRISRSSLRKDVELTLLVMS